MLVTGASSGIGEAIAVRAAAQGARVALVARTASTLEDVAARIRESGEEAIAIAADVSVRAQAVAAVESAIDRLGGIDVAFINAGIGRHARFVAQPLDDIERIVQTNVLGALYTTHRVARAMCEAGRGFIAITASIAGLLGVPDEAVYSASKFALVGLAEALSIELEADGVHVMALCPGAVRTGFVDPSERDRIPEAARRTMVETEGVVDALFDGLARGAYRVIVPASLRAAVIAKGLAPNLARLGIERATRGAGDKAR